MTSKILATDVLTVSERAALLLTLCPNCPFSSSLLFGSDLSCLSLDTGGSLGKRKLRTQLDVAWLV